MRSKIIKLIEEDILNIVRQINLENIDYCKEIIEKELELIQILKEIRELKFKYAFIANEEKEERVDEKVHDETVGTTSEQSPLTVNENAETKKMYRFERKVRGGYIPEIGGFVPEGIVRRLELNHGDYIYATPVEKNKKHFIYELAQKAEKSDSPHRVQHNFCIVKEVAGRLAVDYSIETGKIRYEGQLHTILLDENEVIEYGVKEGSIIDIAYPTGKPDQAKILWVHKLYDEDIIIEPGEFDRQNREFVKKSSKKKDKKDYKKTLKGKTVLVIGNEPMKAIYQHEIEKRGGTFLWGDAKDSLDILESLVKKSDLVIFLLKVSGHVGMEHIKSMCKKNNIPFETTWSNGKSTIIRIAEEVH